MHALIDADIFCYEIGSMKNPDTGVPLPWPIIKRLVDERIDNILEKTEAETWQGYLTGKGNFRIDLASIQPYKDHRGEKPFWYQGIYNYLRDSRNCDVVDDREADDAMAIQQGHSRSAVLRPELASTIICSRDKDLKQVPGWHFIWESGRQKERLFWVSELDGWKSFFSQCLTGDPVDNILGLYNVGEKAASVQRVKEAEDELTCLRIVKDEYKKRFGSYWDMFLYENGTLLWMLRSEDDAWYRRQKEFDRKLDG